MNPEAPRWDRRQKRIFHRCQSCLAYWEANGFQGVWLNLTGAPGADKISLARHYRTLLRRIERTFGYRGMEYLVVKTDEGNGVLHALLFWRPGPGEPRREFWIPFRWLSNAWAEIHGAPVVVVKRYSKLYVTKRGRTVRSVRALSRYLVSQYVGGQVGIVRCFWTWKRTFGAPLSTIWRRFRRTYTRYGMKSIVERWHRFLSGENVPTASGRVWNLAALRGQKRWNAWPVTQQIALSGVER